MIIDGKKIKWLVGLIVAKCWFNKTFWTHIDGMLEKTLCETPVYIL